MQTFHEELSAKRESVDRTLSRCRRMLQESPSEEHSSVDVDIRLTTIREQFDTLCQRSDRRSVSCLVSNSARCSIACNITKCKSSLGCTGHIRQYWLIFLIFVFIWNIWLVLSFVLNLKPFIVNLRPWWFFTFCFSLCVHYFGPKEQFMKLACWQIRTCISYLLSA